MFFVKKKKKKKKRKKFKKYNQVFSAGMTSFKINACSRYKKSIYSGMQA
jgi:hypothetical protein